MLDKIEGWGEVFDGEMRMEDKCINASVGDKGMLSG